MTTEALHDLADRFWAFQCVEFPIDAVQAGVNTDADVLLRLAPEDFERRAAWAKEAMQQLAAIDSNALTTENRATHALLKREIKQHVDAVAVRSHLRPMLYPLGPEFSFTYWAGATSLATPEEARRYIARLARIPEALAGVLKSLAQGHAEGMRYPRLVAERAADQIKGQVAAPVERSPFYGPLGRAAPRSAAFSALAAEGAAVITAKVYPAFLDYARFVEETLAPAARQSLACVDDVDGEALYRLAILEHTTLDLSAAEIHALGLSEVARLSDEMLAVAGEAGFVGDLAGFRRRLQTDNQQFAESGEALREQIEVLSKRIDARIPEFFGRTPRATYGIKSIPEALAAKMPPAYAQPNPADGASAGVHWVTSLPQMLPRYMQIPIALHEAWPGHLMHLALIQEQDHLPAFRRYGAMRYSSCLEGWALYSERLGEDMGFYDTPEKRYGRLEMEMWRAVRLVVDTGIHSKGWTREQALDYFQQNMAMPIETMSAEVDRYIGWPGQALAYQLGNLKFRALRQKAETALGDNFRIRDFHDALMSAGPATLPVLEQIMDEWLGKQLKPQAA
jgi:uncharacterized protein (DUF885 family)